MARQSRVLHSATTLFWIFAAIATTDAPARDFPQAHSALATSISVHDVMRQSLVGDPNAIDWHDGAAQLSTTSPNGRYVAVVVRRGNPDALTNEAELLIYEVAQLLNRPKPRVLARFASQTNYQPIAQVRWLADNDTLTFVATQGRHASQVYKVGLRNGRLTQLTDGQQPLASFHTTPAGEFIATVREPARESMATNEQCQQSGCLVTQTEFYSALTGSAESSYPVTRHDQRFGHVVTLRPATDVDPGLYACVNKLAGGLSPDGRFGLQECGYRKFRWPEWWRDYIAYPGLDAMLRTGVSGHVRQLVLLDFESQTAAKLTSAPFPTQSFSAEAQPQWIDGGRRLLLAGALEPLDADSAEERRIRASRFAILLFDPHSRRSERIAWLPAEALLISQVHWNQLSETVTVRMLDRSRQSLPERSYRRRGSRWDLVPPRIARDSRHDAAPRLVLEQSLNDPPKLFAITADGSRKALVLDPNPWLAERRLSRVEVIRWTSLDGKEWSGGLYSPPDYVPGRRYPLVLQTHGFEPQQFSLSGITRNFAAQPLAAFGIFVLQIEENKGGATGAEQWPAVQAGYEAAIDCLTARGLIDRERVGMVGWSWTAPAVGYTLTHSSYPIAAAAFADAADLGWWYYVLQGGNHGETQYSTPPFGEGLDVWQRMSATFNLDRVHTPMIMWTGGFLSLWDWYALSRRLGKPVEYWYLPDGTHEVFKVGERIRTNQLFVDWFRFWLKDEEDPDEAKAGQYTRWRAMRDRSSTLNTSLRRD